MTGLDITPQVPAGRKIVQAYGEGRFRISGEGFEGSVIVWPEGMAVWTVSKVEDITADSLAVLHETDDSVDLLIIGCGPEFGPEPAGLRSALKERGLSLEWMDTGAACRTYNVLVGEERRVAAALIAVD